MQALTDGLSLPVELYGALSASTASDRFFVTVPVTVGGDGDINTRTLLAPGALSNDIPSIADAPGATRVSQQQLLDARGAGSLAYVTAGATPAQRVQLPSATCHRACRPDESSTIAKVLTRNQRVLSVCNPCGSCRPRRRRSAAGHGRGAGDRGGAS